MTSIKLAIVASALVLSCSKSPIHKYPSSSEPIQKSLVVENSELTKKSSAEPKKANILLEESVIMLPNKEPTKYPEKKLVENSWYNDSGFDSLESNHSIPDKTNLCTEPLLFSVYPVQKEKFDYHNDSGLELTIKNNWKTEPGF